MTSLDDPLVQLHLSVAEIKGMLSTVIASHAEKISGLESKVSANEIRLNDKGRRLATLEEQSDNMEEDIKEIKQDGNAKAARNLSVTSIVIAALVATLSIFNAFNGG